MHSRTTLKRHADLVDRMVGTLGIDLEESMMRGHLRPGELSDAVLRCSGCTDPGHCAGWLAQQTGIVEQGPAYCRNTEMLADLQALKG